jgi:eukaryotic-like serine/threonine-protein kinase
MRAGQSAGKNAHGLHDWLYHHAAMANPQLIRPVPAGTPPELAMTRSHVRVLPYDLLREASNRLSVLCLLAAALWVVATLLDHLAMKAMGAESNLHGLQLPDIVAGISVVVSLALYLYSRKELREPRFILDLGLIYMVYTAAALGLMMHWGPVSDEPIHIFPMITWVGAVILMFAAIVPNSPVKTLIAGLIAVSMSPVGMLIGKARGIDFGPASNMLLMHYPDYLLVGVAVVISHVVTKLGQKVNKAREMGSYQLITLIGKGGMGEVWRARHRMLTRDAAIKLIQPHIAGVSGKNSALMQRRFEQEAKATASLRSPHTIELYDFGVSEDGVFYYVMELLDGIDLETLVKKFGPQSPARVVYILRQVCRSLADAHNHGLIHRDIKPTNIFLCRMGNEFDYAKVLDFGLVKVLESTDTQMTGANATTGTPAYMAPELAMGSSSIDGRTDLYGLGCVAYWLLTGSMVFEENGAAAMMLAHLQKVPVPPSRRTELAVPESLDRAILMCLAKAPADRPASAEVFGRTLEESTGTASWTPEDAERWWLAHRPENAAVNPEDAPSKYVLQTSAARTD